MKRICTLFMIFFLALPIQYSAETTVKNSLKLEELSVQVMPEYSYHPKDTKKNKPPLLIGYQGTFINSSDQPQKGKIAIPLPANQKEIKVGFAADYSSDLSEVFEIEYELDKENGVITWTTSTEIQPGDLYKFIVEFYSESIKQKNDSKNFEFTFRSFADIGLVYITFLEPLDAKSTNLQPKPEQQQENPYGMNMFMYQIAGMKTGDQQEYAMTYERSSKVTTIEKMNQLDGNQEKQPVEPKKVESNEIYLVVGGVGAFSILSALLLIFLLRNRGKNEKQTILKGIHSTNFDDKTLLRSKLIQGEISKQEYDERIKKL